MKSETHALKKRRLICADKWLKYCMGASQRLGAAFSARREVDWLEEWALTTQFWRAAQMAVLYTVICANITNMCILSHTHIYTYTFWWQLKWPSPFYSNYVCENHTNTLYIYIYILHTYVYVCVSVSVYACVGTFIR